MPGSTTSCRGSTSWAWRCWRASGFTVSLLIGELAYGPGTERDELAKVGVLVGSLAAACLAAVVLRMRNRVYRRICEAEERDDDRDGVPDVFEGDVPESGSGGL